MNACTNYSNGTRIYIVADCVEVQSALVLRRRFGTLAISQSWPQAALSLKQIEDSAKLESHAVVSWVHTSCKLLICEWPFLQRQVDLDSIVVVVYSFGMASLAEPLK